MSDLKLLFYAGSTLLEGPVWDEKNGLIYCVSIEQNQIYSICPESGKVCSYTTHGNVGCIALKEDGNIIVAEKHGIFELDLVTKKYSFITGDYSLKDIRYNDGKLDPDGTFLVGIKGDSKDYPNEGCLFSLKDHELTPLITGTTIANGLGFNQAGDVMYFIDTPTLEVGMYQYDRIEKKASYIRPVVRITDGGSPDGMCVDLDGNIWVAEWGGAKVCKWDVKTGEKIEQIDLPVTNVSSCCIGGSRMNQLFITTAKSEKDEMLSGGLFVFDIR